MCAIRRDLPDAFDDVLLLVAPDDAHRRMIRERLAEVRGSPRPGQPGAHPRFKLLTASSGAESLKRAAGATIAMVNLELPKGPGLETIRELRESHERLAILAYATAAGASDAMAAVMAGADFFFDCHDESSAALGHAVELAVERRRLTHTIEQNEADVEEARGRLAQLAGELVGTMPGLWPLRSREDVLPFREAARRYLLAATRFFARDPRGLAKALGVSYFSLRRLLARYDVPFPAARSRK
ncbi:MULTISPECIES: response regulator [unclassified Anaeromyxobacter]|uniref:response regulator n=1 Tax=unclassified Anaeromyxobacter TaxID=2620896 RepID=UPI001F596C42|nr:MULTISPECIES: response regulator [unclassified Anaeromyxobacter]